MVLAPLAAVTVFSLVTVEAGNVTVAYETELAAPLPLDTVTVDVRVAVTVEAPDRVIVFPARAEAVTVMVLIPPVLTVRVE